MAILLAGNDAAGRRKSRGKKTASVPGELFPNIEYPKEIQLLDELNEANKQKYKKWLHRKMLVQELLGKSTLLIGVRGKDGVVLGADRKAMRGGETDFENKVKTMKVRGAPITFAGAGVVGVIDDFIEVFEKTLAANIQAGKVSSLLSIKMIAEDLVEKTEERYGPKLGEYPLHFLFGGLSELRKGVARLYEIGSRGFGQKVKYTALVGHGSPYARTIAKYLFPRDARTGIVPLDCKEIVCRLATCIYWIREEVDDFVGGEPQITYKLVRQAKIIKGKYNKAKIQKQVHKIKSELSNVSFGTGK